MSINDYCIQLAEDMAATWRCLPISHKLKAKEPIPIRAWWANYAGSTSVADSDKYHAETTQDAIREAIDAAKGNPVVVLFGGPGAGKTVAMKWMAYEQANRFLISPNNSLVPIYIDLGAYTKVASLEAIQQNSLTEAMKDEKISRLWLMDGLDLLTASNALTAREILSQAQKKADSRNSFLFSTRPAEDVKNELNGWGRSIRIELEALRPETRLNWIEQYAPSAKMSLARFEKSYGESHSFFNTPLLFALVLSGCLDEDEDKKCFCCNYYPGRAGLFHGFTDYALRRIGKKLTPSQWKAVHGVFWAALRSGCTDRILTADIAGFCQETGEDLKGWESATTVLEAAGLLWRLHNQDGFSVLHQQFAEYWAGQYLAARLSEAAHNSYFLAEIWDHLCECRLDTVTAQGLAILSRTKFDFSKTRSDSGKYLKMAYKLLSEVRIVDAVDLFADVGGQEAIAILHDALKDKDSEVRGTVVKALGNIGGPEVIVALREALKEQDGWVRLMVAEALGEIGGSEAIAILQGTLLNDKDSWVRLAAAEALRSIGGPEALAALRDALKNKDDKVRRSAAVASGKIGGPEVLAALCDALTGQDDFVRHRAADALKEIGGPEAITAFSDALTNKDDEVRSTAALMLGEIGGPEVLATLCKAIKNQDIQVRLAAIDSLEKIGGQEVIAILRDALKDQNSSVRLMAADALGGIGGHEVIAILHDTLKDQDTLVRRTSAEALSKIGGPVAIAALRSMEKDQDNWVRLMVAEALSAVDNSASITLLRDVLKDQNFPRSRRMRWLAAEALGEIGGPAAEAILRDALKDHDDWVRLKAAEALGELEGPETVVAFRDALKDQDDWVRQEAVKALGKIGGPEVIAILRDALKNQDPFVCLTAAEVLGEIGGPAAIAALRKALKNHDRQVHYVVIEALGKIGGPDRINFCREICVNARAEGVEYKTIYRVTNQLGRRPEPWSFEKRLNLERRKRTEHFNNSTGGRGMTYNRYHIKIGDIKKSNISIGSKNVQQNMHNVLIDQKKMQKLVERLQCELKKAPKDKVQDAECVIEKCKDLTEMIGSPRPSRGKIQISKKGLIEAAEALAHVVPTVLPIARKIAEIIGGG